VCLFLAGQDFSNARVADNNAIVNLALDPGSTFAAASGINAPLILEHDRTHPIIVALWISARYANEFDANGPAPP